VEREVDVSETVNFSKEKLWNWGNRVDLLKSGSQRNLDKNIPALSETSAFLRN